MPLCTNESVALAPRATTEDGTVASETDAKAEVNPDLEISPDEVSMFTNVDADSEPHADSDVIPPGTAGAPLPVANVNVDAEIKGTSAGEARESRLGLDVAECGLGGGYSLSAACGCREGECGDIAGMGCAGGCTGDNCLTISPGASAETWARPHRRHARFSRRGPSGREAAMLAFVKTGIKREVR